MKQQNRNILIIILIIIVLMGFIYLKNLSKQNIKLEHEVEKIKNESIETSDNQPPEIIEVSFTNILDEDLLKDGWFTVGEDNKAKINIKVKGNCTSVDMFITPTGTETYVLQKMVDSLIGGPGENQFEYIWNVPEGTIGHFWIIAYNGDIGRKSKSFNIYNDY